jgi:hypothetical protein
VKFFGGKLLQWWNGQGFKTSAPPLPDNRQSFSHNQISKCILNIQVQYIFYGLAVEHWHYKKMQSVFRGRCIEMEYMIKLQQKPKD